MVSQGCSIEMSVHIIQSIPSTRQPPASQYLHLWVTSNPNTEDHIDSPRNGTKEPASETQSLNNCSSHGINWHRLLNLTGSLPTRLGWHTETRSANYQALLKLLMTNHKLSDNFEASQIHRRHCLCHFQPSFMLTQRVSRRKRIMSMVSLGSQQPRSRQ